MKILALGVALFLSLQDAKQELKWKFEKGQEFRYQALQKTSMEAGGMAMEQEVRNTFAQKVLDVDAKGATLQVTYEAIAAKASGMQEYDYDSEKDKEEPEDPTPKMMSKLVGQSFTVKMTPSGRVIEVKGFDKILDAMAAGMGDEQSAAMMKQMLKQMFSDESAQSMMQQMYLPLPEEKVAKGDRWTNEYSMQIPFIGKAQVKLKSKLEDVKAGNAHIDQDIEMEIKADPNAMGAVEMKGMKGKSSGVFSPERGLLLSAKAEMEMTMSMNGQEMPIKSTNDIKLLEKGQKR